MDSKKPAAVEIAVKTDVTKVRDAWRKRVHDQGPVPCPVCRHVPQLRKYVFTTTMALALIHLHHRGGPAAAVSIPEVVSTGESLKKLVLWGLAAEVDEGVFQLTGRGAEVVQLRRKVERECVASHGVPLWYSPEEVWLNETLNQRYSYEDLMAVSA